MSFERKVEAQSLALAHDSGSFGHKDLEGCVVWSRRHRTPQLAVQATAALSFPSGSNLEPGTTADQANL